MYSLIILKPDAVMKQIHGSLISEICTLWHIQAMELRTLNVHEVSHLYSHLVERDCWPRVQTFMTCGPSVPMIVQTGESTVGEVREFALERRLRYNFKERDSNSAMNVIHATEHPEDAYRECDLIFPGVRL